MGKQEVDISQFIKDIKKLPTWIKHYGLNHHSPSQLNKIDGAWCYEYLHLTQEQRRKLPGNAKMYAGVQMGTAGQLAFGNYEWQGSKKIEIKKQRNIFEKILETFNAYLPNDEKDRNQHDVNRKGLTLTFENLKKAFDEVGLNDPIECERTVWLNLPKCQLPCIGRIDFEDQKNFIELKTKWRYSRKRKDGTITYPLYGIKNDISAEYLLQCAFYHLATGKKPHLVIVSEEEYKIFSPDNCEVLKPKNLKKILNKMAMIALRRERLMERHAGKSSFVQDVEPTFDHPFYWNFGGNHKQEAMKLWGIET